MLLAHPFSGLWEPANLLSVEPYDLLGGDLFCEGA